MINVAFVTYDNDVVESIRGFHSIEFTPHHVVFRMNVIDKNSIIAIRADKIHELVTEKDEE